MTSVCPWLGLPKVHLYGTFVSGLHHKHKTTTDLIHPNPKKHIRKKSPLPLPTAHAFYNFAHTSSGHAAVHEDFLAVKDQVATTTQTQRKSMMMLTTINYSSGLLPEILHPLTFQRQGFNP
jgi:hypothetical protein